MIFDTRDSTHSVLS